MFNQIVEEAVAKVEQRRQQQIEVVKQKVTQEKIVPFNIEIDTMLREAIKELQNKHNEKIATMQREFEAEKTALTGAAATKKAGFAEATIREETARINQEAEATISHLRKILTEV